MTASHYTDPRQRAALPVGDLFSDTGEGNTPMPLLSARELNRVLDRENEPGVAQHLGFVIEACGNKPLARVVRDWLPNELTPVALVPGKGKRGNLPLVTLWQVLNNSSELKV